MDIKELQGKDVVLTPFCAESVLLYHQLELEGISTALFFDRNPLLENQKYKDTFIRRIYKRINSVFIICKPQYYQEIRGQLLGRGIEEDRLIKGEDVEINVNYYEAASHVDFDTFKKLLPSHMSVYTDNSDFLKLKKYKRIYDLGGPYSGFEYELFDGMWRKDNYKDQNGKSHIFIKRFELDVTSKCSLRCKKCGAMMQYFHHPVDIPFRQVIDDYNRMLELIEWTDDVLIMGGEPFIQKELDKILKAIKENPLTEKKVGMVKIVTNGTIVPRQEVLDQLMDTDISVMISNYGEYSRQMNALITCFQENRIKYDVLDYSSWGNVQQLVDREEALSEEELLERRKRCWKRHHAVSEGKFYLCAFSNFSQKLSAVPFDENNYVDIYENDACEKIIDFLSPDRPLPKACSWCNGNFPENWEGDGAIPVAEQTSTVLSYRKFEG